MLLVERTQEASEMAVKEIKEMADRKKKGKKRYRALVRFTSLPVCTDCKVTLFQRFG